MSLSFSFVLSISSLVACRHFLELGTLPMSKSKEHLALIGVGEADNEWSSLINQ